MIMSHHVSFTVVMKSGDLLLRDCIGILGLLNSTRNLPDIFLLHNQCQKPEMEVVD